MMKKIMILLIGFLHCFCFNAEARSRSYCGSFKEMKGSVKKILSPKGKTPVNYVGDSVAVQVDFKSGRILIEGGICSPVGEVCVSDKQKVMMQIECSGGSYRDISLKITRKGKDKFKVEGAVGFFSKTYTIQSASFSRDNSIDNSIDNNTDRFFSMDVRPAKKEYEVEQVLRHLNKAKRNQRIERLKNRSRQPFIGTTRGFSRSIDI